jgi:IS1 family transposase/transposase-like protein
MLCSACGNPARRFGHDRRGRQRYQCPPCRRTFTDPSQPATDNRRVPRERAELCLRLLLEGCSIRSTERLTKTHRDTIIGLLVDAGERCQRFLERQISKLPVGDIEGDEIWAFIGCKEKTRERNNYAEIFGDAYCFTALERTTKMIVAWHLGKRSPEDTRAFALKLHNATSGRFQLTTDGFRPYLTAVPSTFGHGIDFATLVKVYGESEDERRYSPPRVMSVVATPRIGTPDESRICTSHVERSNLSIRMAIRRFTRLTNAFSKKWENHEAALALFFAFYNYSRVHQTLKCTPAVKAGLALEAWTLEKLLEQTAAA